MLFIYIYLFIGCKKFGRPGSTRVWTWLLSDIRYRFMTGVSTSLLCVFCLPANDLTYPCKVVVQRFWAALLTAMWFKDVAKSRKLNISNGAFCQVACLPKYGEHHLCEPQTCAGWLNVWEEKIWSGNPLPISACFSLFNGFFFEAAGALAGLGSQPGSRAAHSPALSQTIRDAKDIFV